MSTWKIVRILVSAVLALMILVLTAPFLFMGIDIGLVAAGVYDDQAVSAVPSRSETIAIYRHPIWSPFLGNEFQRTLVISENGHEVIRSTLDPDTGGASMVEIYQLETTRLLMVDSHNCTIVDLANRRVSKTEEAIDREKLQYIGAFDDYERRNGQEVSDERHTYRFVSAFERGLRPLNDVPGCFKPTKLAPNTFEVSSYFLDPKYIPAVLDQAASKACIWGFGYTRLIESRTTSARGEIWRWQIKCQCASASCRAD